MTELHNILTPLDWQIIHRHAKKANEYARSGITWVDRDPRYRQTAISFINTLLSSDVLQQAAYGIKHPHIVSVSANTGVYEQLLADRLPPDFMVTAGDIALLPREEPSKAEPIQLDASFLPFAHNSIQAILDLQGAIWEEAFVDISLLLKSEVRWFYTQRLFGHYFQKLTKYGVIITDYDHRNEFLSTSYLLTILYMRRYIKGFGEAHIIGDKPYRLAVYKKSISTS